MHHPTDMIVLTWVSPFVQDKKVGFGLGMNRLSCNVNHAEGALPPSITVIVRLKMGY